MSRGCPAIVIAGTGSGVGKTSLTLGIARALARRGFQVQTFKVGPDFLDSTWLAKASGRTCYNLDGWMTGREYVGRLFHRATADADIALVEGVMGLFDGASPSSLEGSTAEIALWLDAPVLLVVNAHGAARSLAAMVSGLTRFEKGVRVAGVIANQGGSQRHRDWLAESLSAAGLPPLIGLVPRDSLPTLPSRHLGLVTAGDADVDSPLLDQLADACQQRLDLDAICRMDLQVRPQEPVLGDGPGGPSYGRIRLGIAQDAAFHFYYPDNLELLAECGAELVPFSPLADRTLPQGLDALYFGGGYPEVHADRLAANTGMLEDVRRFAASGRCIYAECGGLMYLGRSLRAADRRKAILAGVLPIETAMLPRLSVLGYCEVAWTGDSPWGPAGATCRGHEFHYSEMICDESAASGWQRAYEVSRRRGPATCQGFVNASGSVVAGYVHLHWASRPEAARRFVDYCARRA